MNYLYYGDNLDILREPRLVGVGAANLVFESPPEAL